LRAFLGVTFCFAGLQKLANPNFFNPASPSSIQAQLLASERVSPLHAVLGHLLHLATPIGIAIALGELAVGIGTLLGLWARVAAVGGLVLSLTLFLTVSFHASPYFTGADIVFVFAWTPLVLAGAGGVWSVDAVIADRARQAQPGRARQARPNGARQARPNGARQARPDGARQTRPDGARQARPDATPGADPARRALVLGATAAGLAAIGTVVVAGLAAGLGRLVGGAKVPRSAEGTLPGAGSGQGTSTTAPASTSAPTTAPAGGASSTTAPAGSDAPSTAAPPPTQPPATTTPAGTAIGPASDVPVGGSARFTDPSTGDPGLMLQLSQGDFVAYDAVCPHAGCTVGYSPAAKLIVCPCHGSEFNPSSGAVEVGPATRGLRQIRVSEGGDGQLYVDG